MYVVISCPTVLKFDVKIEHKMMEFVEVGVILLVTTVILLVKILVTSRDLLVAKKVNFRH